MTRRTRATIIKFFNKSYNSYYYLSRMPSEGYNEPEFTLDCKEAVRFTHEEAVVAYETLRGVLCDQWKVGPGAVATFGTSFGDLLIDDVGPKEIIDGEARPFLLWADAHHPDTLDKLLHEYIAQVYDI